MINRLLNDIVLLLGNAYELIAGITSTQDAKRITAARVWIFADHEPVFRKS